MHIFSALTLPFLGKNTQALKCSADTFKQSLEIFFLEVLAHKGIRANALYTSFSIGRSSRATSIWLKLHCRPIMAHIQSLISATSRCWLQRRC